MELGLSVGWAEVRISWTEWLEDMGSCWPGSLPDVSHIYHLPRGPRKVHGLPVGCPIRVLQGRDRLVVLAFLMALCILMATVTLALLSLRDAHWRG